MTAADYIVAGIPLAGDDPMTMLKAEAALDWMQEHTTLKFDRHDADTIAALPACAKLFVVKYSEAIGLKQGVTHQSMEGMTQSFDTSNTSALIWQLANNLLGAYIKSHVRVFPARRRW